MKTDIQIASEANMLPISKIANDLGLNDNDYDMYGKYKAKLNLDILNNTEKEGNLILVSAITPTPAGEGKTTTNVGLSMALNKIGKKSISTLREPSLGPCFGIKGGAAGGGYSQVIPMEDINLHFTGDIHAITAANNLLAAMLDNHIHQGNILNIDTRKILWKRAVDINDRALRNIVVGLGGKVCGIPREDGFNISVASEIMAVLCLSDGISDLKSRLSKMVVAFDKDNNPVTCEQLEATGALLLLLKEAIKPNLVQTLENTPAIIHGGPFANIAHGCNSVIATKIGLKLADYVVTEAGFGADLGAEKFFNIKCQMAGLKPKASVLVATIRALKMHGGVKKTDLVDENIEALKLGYINLKKQVENLLKFNIPVVVAINKFPTDTDNEVKTLEEMLKVDNFEFSLSDVFSKGSEGAIELAHKVVSACENNKNEFLPLYNKEMSIKDKISKITKEIYGAKNVNYSANALKDIALYEKLGYSNLLVCMAKTQYSLSDDPTKLGVPTDFDINIREIRLSAGAGFIVAISGSVMTMPGLPKVPAANKMDVLEDGEVIGLF